MRIYRLAANDIAEIQRFLSDYVKQNGGIQACRHGGCTELVEAFIELHGDAEMWETWEIDRKYDNLPLKLSKPEVQKICKLEKENDISMIGSFGTHAVVIWHGYVFDAGGISTLEGITTYFGCDKSTHWIRTM